MRQNRGPRMRRVNELLREIVADEVPRLKDPRIGFVTITGVDCAPDLRHATVYYSVLGSEEEQADTAEALEHSAPHLQAIIGPQVKLKYIPRLHFRRDPAIEAGMRMEEILRRIQDHEEGDGPDGVERGG